MSGSVLQKKLLFMTPPVCRTDLVKRVPLGICYLASVARKSGLDVRIIDAYALNLDVPKAAASVLEWEPDFVAISSMSEFFGAAKAVAEKIKKVSPKTVMIIGGPHISVSPADMLDSSFDFGVTGEVHEQINQLIKKTPLSNIAGLVYKKDGFLVTNKPSLKVFDLDSAPFPSLDMLEGFPSVYTPTANAFKQYPSVSLVTSSGCAWNCHFCHQAGSVFKHNSAGYILSLVESLHSRFGVKDIYFFDDIFTVPREKIIDFCDGLIRKNIGVTWSCYSRIDTIDCEIVWLMKKAGCWKVSFGIESGSDRILRILNKKITRKQIIAKIREVKSAGIKVRGFFMLGNPGETKDTLSDTESLIRLLDLDDLFVDFFTPFKGIALERGIEKHGRIISSSDSTSDVTFLPSGLSKRYLEKTFRQIWLKFYLRPRILWSYSMTLFSPHKAKYIFKGFLLYLKLLFK